MIENGVLVKYTGERYIDTIILPAEVKEIGKNAFTIGDDELNDSSMGNINRISICIPKDVTIQAFAFENAIPLDITFEEGRKKIEDYAFYYASSNVSITLPKSIIELGDYAFASIDSPELHLNDEIEVIGDYALEGTTCSIPPNVKSIGKGAFGSFWEDNAWDSYADRTLCLPEQLEVIEDVAFEIEEPRGYIHIPASVKSIGEGAFAFGDNAYKSGFSVDSENEYFKSEDGWLYSKDGKRLIYAYIAKGDIIIPDGVEYVGKYSLNTDLNGEGGIQEIYLPSTLKEMNTLAVNSKNIHFKGNQPPEIVGDSDFWDSRSVTSKFRSMKIYVPKGTKQEYIDAFEISEEHKSMVVEE